MTRPNRRRIAGEQAPRSTGVNPPVVRPRSKAASRPAAAGEPAVGPDEPRAPRPVDAVHEPLAAKPRVPSAGRSGKLAAPDGPRTDTRARQFPWLLAAIALVAFVGGTALLANGIRAHQQQDAGEGPADAAQVAVTTIDTFDYLDMDAHDKRAMRLMTDSFAQKKSQWQPLTAKQAEDVQGQGAARVLAAATMWCSRDCSGDRAKVLVFYDQQVSSKDIKKPAVSTQRAILTMVRIDGRWLVDGIERIRSDQRQ